MADNDDNKSQLALQREAARNLATTTKTVPQMQGISSRHLLKVLPWVHVPGGVYRVNRLVRKPAARWLRVKDIGGVVSIEPASLTSLPLLRGFKDDNALTTFNYLAGLFEPLTFNAGEALASPNDARDSLTFIVHGKVNKLEVGKYGEEVLLKVLRDGDHFGEDSLLPGPQGTWQSTFRAVSPCTVLRLSKARFDAALPQFPALREHVIAFHAHLDELTGTVHEETGEDKIELSARHEEGEELAGSFPDYEVEPREYELSVAQTVLRIHSRVADLFNEPINQTEQQLRLTIEALKERKEDELINHPEFGLLNNVERGQRIHTRDGHPSPDDMDMLLSLVWKEPAFFLAHPRAIAAFGHECNRLGLYPATIDMNGNAVPAWRGIPILACNKIPIDKNQSTSILLMRVGEKNQGVVGLHHAGIPDEVEPSLSVRFMGINENAIISYLVTTYFSAAVLTPDALGVLASVQLGRSHR